MTGPLETFFNDARMAMDSCESCMSFREPPFPEAHCLLEVHFAALHPAWNVPWFLNVQDDSPRTRAIEPHPCCVPCSPYSKGSQNYMAGSMARGTS